MVTVDQPEEEVVVIGFRGGEEDRNKCSDRGEFLQLTCNVQVGVLEGGEYGEEYLPLRCLQVQVRDGICRSK